MKKTIIIKALLVVCCQLCFLAHGHTQSTVTTTNSYTLENYQMGAMLVSVRIPGNWDAAPIIIGKVSAAGGLTFEWPNNVPEDLKTASDQLNYVIRTGNCEAGDEGHLESDEANYFLFDRIWLMDPESKDVQGQLMAASNDDIRKWMHRPVDEKAATGTHAYLLYAFKDNALRSTCQFESWVTPEGQDEITLQHKFENDLKVTKGFQFVIYDTKEVHPYEGMQAKWQQVTASPSIPETLTWKVKE